MIKNQKGVGLIEVLIAVLILAVGLLGFGGMQTQAMRANFESLQRAKASIFANDMFERMRSNITKATTSDAYVIADFDSDLPAMASDCLAVTCDANELAAWDINDWMAEISSSTNGVAKAVIVKPNPAAEPRYFKISIRLVESPRLEASNTDELTNVDFTVDYDFYAVL